MHVHKPEEAAMRRRFEIGAVIVVLMTHKAGIYPRHAHLTKFSRDLLLMDATLQEERGLSIRDAIAVPLGAGR